MNLGSEFSGESERTAKSGIIKLSAICEVIDKVICTKSILLHYSLYAGIFAQKIMKD